MCMLKQRRQSHDRRALECNLSRIFCATVGGFSGVSANFLRVGPYNGHDPAWKWLHSNYMIRDSQRSFITLARLSQCYVNLASVGLDFSLVPIARACMG